MSVLLHFRRRGGGGFFVRFAVCLAAARLAPTVAAALSDNVRFYGLLGGVAAAFWTFKGGGGSLSIF